MLTPTPLYHSYLDRTKWLHNLSLKLQDFIKGYLPNITWLPPLLGPLIALLYFLLALASNLVEIVSSRLQPFHVKLMVTQASSPSQIRKTLALLSGPGSERILFLEGIGTTPLFSRK